MCVCWCWWGDAGEREDTPWRAQSRRATRAGRGSSGQHARVGGSGHKAPGRKVRVLVLVPPNAGDQHLLGEGGEGPAAAQDPLALCAAHAPKGATIAVRPLVLHWRHCALGIPVHQGQRQGLRHVLRAKVGEGDLGRLGEALLRGSVGAGSAVVVVKGVGRGQEGKEGSHHRVGHHRVATHCSEGTRNRDSGHQRCGGTAQGFWSLVALQKWGLCGL
jgi:hypothetical protein